MKNLRLGVIGAGRIGKVHVKTITQSVADADVVAVADVHVKAAKELAAACDIPVATSNYKDIVADDSVDAVVVCSSTATHAEIVEAAATAGKDIFCEKPIDLTLRRTRQAVEAAERAGVKMMVGFNRRFDANFAKVHQIVASGEIGHPEIIRVTGHDPGLPKLEYLKESGGILLDQAIHDFDMARFMAGRDVTQVFSHGEALVDAGLHDIVIDSKAMLKGDMDTVVSVLIFEDGTLATIVNSRRAVYGYDNRVEVFGSKGLISAENESPEHYVRWDAEGFHGPRIYDFFMDRYATAYAREMQAFCESLKKNRPPPSTGDSAILTMAAALAGRRSAREHRPVNVAEVLEDPEA